MKLAMPLPPRAGFEYSPWRAAIAGTCAGHAVLAWQLPPPPSEACATLVSAGDDTPGAAVPRCAMANAPPHCAVPDTANGTSTTVLAPAASAGTLMAGFSMRRPGSPPGVAPGLNRQMALCAGAALAVLQAALSGSVPVALVMPMV